MSTPVLTVGIAAGIVVTFLILWQVPKIQVRRSTRRLPPLAENEYRKTVAQILGGLIVLSGLLFAWTESREQLRISESGQVTERFSRAVEQLASEKVPERLGGIYALERIAKDSEDDHWSVMEILTAFLRGKPAGPALAEALLIDSPAGIAEDYLAALTVIGRREVRNDEGQLKRGEWDPNSREHPHGNRLNLVGADLTWANLVQLNLSYANLSNANLSDTDLFETNLSGAVLRGANLSGARIFLTNLSSASLSGADLSGVTAAQSDLSKARLSRANLSGARLLDTDFSGARLMEAKLSGAYLARAKNLTKDQVRLACGDTANPASLPDGFEQPRACPNPGQDPDLSAIKVVP